MIEQQAQFSADGVRFMRGSRGRRGGEVVDLFIELAVDDHGKDVEVIRQRLGIEEFGRFARRRDGFSMLGCGIRSGKERILRLGDVRVKERLTTFKSIST